MTRPPHKLASEACAVVWIMLIVAVIPWRQGDFYSGGIDPVVVAKALLQVAALAASMVLRRRSGATYFVNGGTVSLVLLLIIVASVGSLASGNLAASTTLAVRLCLLAATIAILASSLPPMVLVEQLALAAALVGVATALTGLGKFVSGGRLGSSLPPLSPNAISMLVGLPALVCLHRILFGRGGRWSPVGLTLLGAILLATGSRTALISFAVAAVIMFAHVRRMTSPVAATLLALVPVGFAVVMYSPLIQQLAVRSTGGSNATLNSRTIAWGAVLSTPVDSWQYWIGAGLSVKTIPVVGQYWTAQVLDSSWISALAQSGVVGALILALICVRAIYFSMRSGQLRALTTAALIFVLIRSALENGLTESSPAFIILLLISLVVHKPETGGEPKGSPPDLGRQLSVPVRQMQWRELLEGSYPRKDPKWRVPVG